MPHTELDFDFANRGDDAERRVVVDRDDVRWQGGPLCLEVTGRQYLKAIKIAPVGGSGREDLRGLPDCAKRIQSNPKSRAKETTPLPTGYHTTGPIIEMRREVRRRGDDLRGAFGIFRGLLVGAALWAVIGGVAISIGSSGDARDIPKAPVTPVAVTPHTGVTIDRGGHTYDR